MKYFENKEAKTTTAVLENCQDEAVAYVEKRLSNWYIEEEFMADVCEFVFASEHQDMFKGSKFEIPHKEALKIPEKIRATVRLNPVDRYNKKVGQLYAKEKAMENKKSALRKAIKRWQIAMLKDIMAINPETFKEALEKVMPKDSKEKTKVETPEKKPTVKRTAKSTSSKKTNK